LKEKPSSSVKVYRRIVEGTVNSDHWGWCISSLDMRVLALLLENKSFEN
jgi:hypothetical protein